MFSFLLQTSIVFVLLPNVLSSSIIEKSLKRRQADATPCVAIQGFDCKCSYYRLTCTTDRDLPSQFNVDANEKGKYQSVELVIAAHTDVQVTDRTFEPIKSFFKLETDNLEFRVKFEKFLSLQLSSPGIFNNIFPETSSSTVRKHIALEIYNPEVPPQENKYLFQNLNADSLELYALYPFHGTFQELFNGANIKYLRLSGGDIRSDLSQPFSGNIARLELAKQASDLSIQNFPVYPAHELIINAFYISKFQTNNPPNYSNLGELRVHSPERIPANAFAQFSNIHTLSISAENGIDNHALHGLSNLEKLVIKDTSASIDLINTVPQIKELEVDIEKFDAHTQCQLVDKLANGHLALQMTPKVRECTCLAAFLDYLSGRSACDAENCDQSTCLALRNSYDATKKTFLSPTAIYRRDGTDAFRPRDLKVYSGPYQVTNEDRLKFEQVFPQQQTSEDNQGQQESAPSSDNRPDVIDHETGDRQSDADHRKTGDSDEGDIWAVDDRQSDADHQKTGDSDEGDIWSDDDRPSDRDQQETLTTHSTETHREDQDDDGDERTNPIDDDNKNSSNNQDQADEENSTSPLSDDSDKPASVDDEQPKTTVDNDNNNNNNNEEGGQSNDEQDKTTDGQSSEETGSKEDQPSKSDAEQSNASKAKFNWLPIIIVVAAFVGLLLLGVIFFVIQQRKKQNGSPVPNEEPPIN